jgi:hypothetical protein
MSRISKGSGYLRMSDVAVLRDIVAAIQQRIARFQQGFSESPAPGEVGWTGSGKPGLADDMQPVFTCKG